MSKEPSLNKARKQLIDIFLNALEEERLPWRKGWKVLGLNKMHNPISNTKYRGVNALLLMMVAYDRGYEDPRWCTFKQASDNGWKVKAGSKSVPVEYWSYYDKTNRRNVSISEYKSLIRNEERKESDFSLVSRTYLVFNASCIEGMPPLVQDLENKLTDIEMNQFMDNIIKNIGVGYREFGDAAFYSPQTDIVTMPPKNQFYNQYEFDSTLLHELSHATGHESRLNREIRNTFASENYAMEELRAEMSSVFLCQYLDIEMNSKHLDKHKAYWQSWAKDLKTDPNNLFKAIKDAEEISNFLIENGEIAKVRTETLDENRDLLDTRTESIENVKKAFSLEEQILDAKKVLCSDIHSNTLEKTNALKEFIR